MPECSQRLRSSFPRATRLVCCAVGLSVRCSRAMRAESRSNVARALREGNQTLAKSSQLFCVWSKVNSSAPCFHTGTFERTSQLIADSVHTLPTVSWALRRVGQSIAARCASPSDPLPEDGVPARR